MRLAIFAPVFVFVVFMIGLFYVAAFERPPVPGRMLPKAPITITKGVAELTDALTNGPWVSPGLKGKVLYKLGYRDCADCINFERTEFADLHAANVDTRVILYARREFSTASERAIVADLACTREWPIYERWLADVSDAYPAIYGMPPAAETDSRRQACLEWGRVVRDRVGKVMQKNGWNMEVPALFWRASNGDWRAYMGDSKRGKKLIRRELGVASAK